MNVLDYFESLRRSIEQNQSVIYLQEPAELENFHEHFGLFRARLYFWDHSHLTIDEVVDTSGGYPDVISYAYTYVRDEGHIFRYDNAPHYPELSTFPHHKHVGVDETPTATEPPTLNQVFKEIEPYLTDVSSTQ